MARSRFRSVRYDLAAAVEVARLVDSAGGTVAADILAPALGYSGTNNGAYLTRVANARLFGVITGRGSRFETTERGRRILAGREPDASVARQEAFFAVPLFRAVADAASQRGGLLPEDLGSWLENEFGEASGKPQTVADRLIASAAEAGMLVRTNEGKYQLTESLTNFTSVDKPPSHARIHQLMLRKSTHSRSGEDIAVAENGLWLEEDPAGTAKRIPAWRRVGVIAAAAVVLVVVAVPVALVAVGSPSQPTAAHKLAQHPRLGNGPAEHQVLAALSATTDSGSFDFSYIISGSPPSSSAPTPTSTTVCNQLKMAVPTGSPTSRVVYPATPLVVGGESGEATNGSAAASGGSGSVSVTNGSASGTVIPTNGPPPPGYQWKTEKVCNGPMAVASQLVQGGGVINTGPKAMVAGANIGGGLDVSVRVNDTDVYEGSSNDTGLAPLASDATASGSSIPGFANITEGTLGNREGAVAMMGMASPTGYLDMVQPSVDAAAKTGTGTVDGTPVTIYQVSNNLDQLATAAGTSPAESQTISAALALLKSQGYTSNTAMVLNRRRRVHPPGQVD